MIDRFQSDHKGRIMTVDSLPSGDYRIYETEAVSGLHISKKFIEVEINSKTENYKRETDSEEEPIQRSRLIMRTMKHTVNCRYLRLDSS